MTTEGKCILTYFGNVVLKQTVPGEGVQRMVSLAYMRYDLPDSKLPLPLRFYRDPIEYSNLPRSID